MNKLCNKILIIGSPGSGKTSLTKKISQKMGIPSIHLDNHYWSNDWRPCDETEWRSLVDSLCKRSSWVMDGSYTSSLPLRLEYATDIIYLDIPRWTCLLRVFKRQLLYFLNISDASPIHCNERLSFTFYKWVLGYPKRSRSKVFSLLENCPKNVTLLRTNKEITNFLNEIY